MRTKRVRIRCRDGVWQTHRILEKNLYKVQARHGEENVIDITEQDRLSELDRGGLA